MQPNMSVRSILFFCIILFLKIDIAFGKDNKSSPALEDVSSSVNFTSSNLPIVVIDTHGQAIPDDPKITADMELFTTVKGQGII